MKKVKLNGLPIPGQGFPSYPRNLLPTALGVLCLTALGGGAPLAAQERVVNPGESIQNAVNQALPGDVVLVRAGKYNQKVSLSAKKGTASAFITLRAEEGVILSGAGLAPVGRQGLITISNSSYIRVEGFEIRDFMSASHAATPVGILVQGSGAHIQIAQNKIHHIKHTSTCQDPCAVGAHGLAVFGTHRAGITDLLISGNEVYENILQSSEALVINGNVERFSVLNNNVHDNNNIGFDFIGYEGECSGCGDNDRVRNGLVRGNIAKNNSSVNNPWYRQDGDNGSAGGFYVDGGQYIVFERNISTGNDLGFEFASEHPEKATENILMINNWVYNNREAGVSLGGSSASNGEARHIYIHNNSFYKNKGWGTELTLQHKVKSSSFSNNIFFSKGSAAQAYETFGTGHADNTWGKNIWWGSSKNSSGLRGTLLIVDPLFVAPDAGNLHLQRLSPAIDAGTISRGPQNPWTSTFWAVQFSGGLIPPHGKVDFDGEPRIQNIIDVGADEYASHSVPTPPPAPRALSATANSSRQITLSWYDEAVDETSFDIERSLAPGAGFVLIATLPGNATTGLVHYPDPGLEAATQYFYRVRAHNGTGASGYSNEANARTQAEEGEPGGVIDWSKVPSIATQDKGGMTALKAYADAEFLYVLAMGKTNTNYGLFINHDNNAATGYSGLWSPEGSDYMLENGVLYKYSGKGRNWKWSTQGVIQTGIEVRKTNDATNPSIEIKIPRAHLVGLQSTLHLGVEIKNSKWKTKGTIPPANTPLAPFTP